MIRTIAQSPSKSLLNRRDDFLAFREGAGAEHGDDLAVLADEVLLEVPFHVPGDLLTRVGGQKLVQRADVVALDGDFFEQIKGDVFLGPAKRLDVRVRAGFLVAEVVGREGQDAQAFFVVLLVQRLQTGVRGVGEPSLAGHVDDQKNIAFVLGERHVLPVDVLDGKVVNGLGRFCHGERSFVRGRWLQSRNGPCQ